jgi:hypothetical protein
VAADSSSRCIDRVVRSCLGSGGEAEVAKGQLLTHAAQQRTSSFGRPDLRREARGFSENHMGKTCIYRDKVYFTRLVCEFLGDASEALSIGIAVALTVHP